MARSLRPDVLGIFVKAPEPGRVKTRLAAVLGDRRAADIYRALGRRVAARCLGPNHDTVVWYAPAGGRAAVREWLRQLRIAAFRAQGAGTLGERLEGAFRRHFAEGARRVVVIGSDCPDVDAGLVGRAFEALEGHDLVLGPARDGGYYLVGLRAPAPELFRGIRWSTDAVLGETVSAARRLALRTRLLPTLRDIDTLSDARAAGLLGLDLERAPGS